MHTPGGVLSTEVRRLHLLVIAVIATSLIPSVSLTKCKDRTSASIALESHRDMTCNLACPVQSALHCGRSCMASLKAQRERDMRMRRARLASAAAQTTAQGQVTHNSTRVFQRARAIGGAAVTPTRSAEQYATVPMRSPAERTRASSAAAASPSCSREAHYNLADTSGSSSGSSYAPSTADGADVRAPEPGGAAGGGLGAGGASHLGAVRCCWPSEHAGRQSWAIGSAA